MAQIQGSASSAGGRLDGSAQQTALVAGDFTLGAGWGTTPIVALTAGSTDQRGTLQITCDATAAQATATVILTFADGAYVAAPFVQVTSTNNQAIDTGHVIVTSTTTATTWTFQVLPVDTKVYIFHYRCIA